MNALTDVLQVWLQGEINSAVDGHTSRISRLEDRIQTQDTQIKTLDGLVESVAHRVGTLEHKHKHLVRAVDALQLAGVMAKREARACVPTPTPEGPRWVMHMPVISTAHMPNSKALEGWNASTCATYAEGGFVYLPDDVPAGLLWTIPIKVWLMKHFGGDANWVRFDADGEEIPDLPTYDWDKA